MSNEKPCFIVDAMLGKLAKKLRLLGYDSLYSSDIEDDEIIKKAKNENRVLITKDAPLVQKALKFQVEAIKITNNDEMDQFLQINKKISLGKCTVSGSTARCPACNGELQSTNKNEVLDKVSSGVYENISDFWTCKQCQKVYWEGTHIKNLQKFTAKLNERLQ